MKLFKFPLESLRTLRLQRERVAQQNYSRALAACDHAGARLLEAERFLAVAWEGLLLEMSEGATAAEILGRRTWCTLLETRRNESKIALDEANRAAGIAREDMVNAVRERESLDKLCEKLRFRHERDQQREEQNSFDELAVQMNGTGGLLQLAGR